MDFCSLLVKIKKLRSTYEHGVCINFSYDIRFNTFVITVVNYIENYKKSVTIDAFDFEHLENDERRNQVLEELISNLVYDVTEEDVKL